MNSNKDVTKVSRVVLKVSDLKRSIKFYKEVVGLEVRKKEKNLAYLSPDGIRDLVILKQPDNPKPAPLGSTGLFHIALLLPRRENLADLWLHLQQHGRWLSGASDHSVSEAVYLEDPDGNGIEIYADREGVPVKKMGTERLQVEDLLQHATETSWRGMPKETVMGHIHLEVRDVSEAVEFYRDCLGFELTAEMGGSAAFMSTGGYHHHIGLNSWNSLGGDAPPENAIGLDRALISVPAQETLNTIKKRLGKIVSSKQEQQEPLVIKDPSGNTLQLEVED
jgi:catechol 2,3-dioxygenase